jgi:hypothetical protein
LLSKRNSAVGALPKTKIFSPSSLSARSTAAIERVIPASFALRTTRGSLM